MIFKLPITPEMRIQLMHAENLIVDLTGHPDFEDLGGFEVVAELAHLHIDVLHALIKSGDLDTAQKMVADWEADECPF
ncbi:hypothetical protein [Shewanella atlantica]|uniref:Uncharacterized protein n=1 Tax=Shewanella atlantica TaxID=271099 RepID=A0A3S0K1C7_9GAMM|nr:hypothetical protein [Shewanella atlantica]RTR33514.1 hypothetical protein EKG39_07265 [Shewanella atlantica]